METVEFKSVETYESEPRWRRVSLVGREQFSFERFEKPPGHSSPTHDHENEQVYLVLDGEHTVYTEWKSEERSTTLGPYDSVWLGSWESHRVENTGIETAIGQWFTVVGELRPKRLWSSRRLIYSDV